MGSSSAALMLMAWSSAAADPAGVQYNPYAGLDWARTDQHKSEFHTHEHKTSIDPHEVIDLYQQEGFTVYGFNGRPGYELPSSHAQHEKPLQAWPWTDLETVYGPEADAGLVNVENRDPAQMGVVAFPSTEALNPEHVNLVFGEDLPMEYDWRNGPGVQSRSDWYAFMEEHDPNASAILAHPNRYANPSQWERYRDDFENHGDTVIGLEAVNKNAPNREDIQLWDNLLTEFIKDTHIWGFGTDDTSHYNRGSDFRLRWTTVLLDEDDFRPSDDQDGSRQAVRLAYEEGRTVFHERDGWNDATQDPVPVPEIESIIVNGNSIEIAATNYNLIQWISKGQIVGTGESIQLTEDLIPYVRAELVNEVARNGGVDRARTYTQPFTIPEPGSLALLGAGSLLMLKRLRGQGDVKARIAR